MSDISKILLILNESSLNNNNNSISKIVCRVSPIIQLCKRVSDEINDMKELYSNIFYSLTRYMFSTLINDRKILFTKSILKNEKKCPFQYILLIVLMHLK